MTLRARISELIAAEKLAIERVRVLGATYYRPKQPKKGSVTCERASTYAYLA